MAQLTDIMDELGTATASELTSANKLLLKVGTAMKSLPGDAVAKAEDVGYWNYSVTMEGSSAVTLKISLIANRIYRISSLPTSWDVSDISSDTNVFFIQNSTGSSTYLSVKKEDVAKMVGVNFTPTLSQTYAFKFRGNEGESITLNIEDATNKAEVYDLPDSVESLTERVENVESDVTLLNRCVDPQERTETLTKVSERYISKNGAIGTASASSYTDVVQLNANENVVIKCKAPTTISVISEYVRAGKYTPLVVGVGADSVQTYSYYNDSSESKNIAFSFRIDSEPDSVEIVKKITGNDSSVDLKPSISFFETIGIIGASYDSGVVYKSSSESMGANYPKSWGQIMARDAGITATNFSYGGATTRSWLKNTSRGLSFLLSEPAKELYIVNLGSNDTSDYGIDYLGTSEDIGTNADTFYGNLSKIIVNIQTHAPSAKIIVDEIRTNDTDVRKAFNEAIRVVADYYSLPTIQVWADKLMSDSIYTTMVGGHPLYMGYAAMAKAYRRMIEDCMRTNKAYFNTIANA